MNVQWKTKQYQKANKQYKLAEHAASIMNSYIKLSIVQVVQADSDIYDISVGMENDYEAFQFLAKKQPVILQDNGKSHQYMPIISDPFQSFINKVNTNQDMLNSYNNYAQSNKQGFSAANLNQGNSRNEGLQRSQKRKNSEKQTKSRTEGEQQSMIYKVWCFGVPKEFSGQQIKKCVENHLKAGESRWKYKQYMEFLELDLITPISKSNIKKISPSIDDYPFIILPYSNDQTKIFKELSKFTAEITIPGSQDDEDKFISCMAQIGGVNLMLRTPVKIRDEFRYIVVFNNPDNVERAFKVAKERDSVMERRVEFRVCRISKYFTFAENLKDMRAEQVQRKKQKKQKHQK